MGVLVYSGNVRFISSTVEFPDLCVGCRAHRESRLMGPRGLGSSGLGFIGVQGLGL